MDNNQPTTPAAAPAATNERELINTELAKFTLEEDTRVRLAELFQPFLERVREWRDKAFALVVTDATQLTEMAKAREGRLYLKGLRNETERLRKVIKEDSLNKGKAIDSIANLVKAAIEPIEAHLDKQERFAEIKEAERKAETKAAREEKLRPLGVTVEFYNLAEMDEASFDALLLQSQQQLAAKQDAERKAAEEKAEAARQDAIERARIAEENARLQAEAKQREFELQQQREAAARKEAELQKQLQAQRDEEARKFAAQEAARKAEQAEAAAKQAQLEAENKRALEAAEKAIADAQASAAKAIADKQKAEAQANGKANAANLGEQTPASATPPASTGTTVANVAMGDKANLLGYIAALENVPLPALTTKDGAIIFKTFAQYFSASTAYVTREANKLNH